ncbi:3-dehydroquinate synthase [Maritalea sp.]|uniref:3-dehydroquinate synthase n=1 Tax=Maritalea sp. TaxID=2003361 RepID=UPI003EF3AFEC
MTEQITKPNIVTIDLGHRSYDINVDHNAIDTLGATLKSMFPGARFGIVTDENVEREQLPRLKKSLDAEDLQYSVVSIAAGESSKSNKTLNEVIEALLAQRLERNDIIIAFGGGVVGDLAGFASSVMRRGMDFVQVPTSLLAQVDSSVGGKTGINSPHGKNLIGAFHQPRYVAADLTALETLSERQFRAGYAEMAKYGLIDDAEFFFWLEENWREIFEGGPARAKAIAHACRAKARFVKSDEKEHGVRALLNLGHTFGHAFEAATGYSDRLLHGEAIAVGMVLAHRYSTKLGLANGQDAVRVTNHFKTVGLPTELSDIPGTLASSADLMHHIAQDKKVSRGALTFILTRGIGEAFIETGIEPNSILEFLEEQRS